ncbi:MAG: type II toxin-antitoxin system HicA family toxin [Planctomycetes bacterium]|nr:type II toxin-antitoxin system HicA family toxin [Planctomycetota bacterium]
MSKTAKLLIQIMSGSSDSNIPFDGLRNVLSSLGFEERIKGDHYIFSREGIEEIINIQPKSGKAKAYQIKQVRKIISEHKLLESEDD